MSVASSLKYLRVNHFPFPPPAPRWGFPSDKESACNAGDTGDTGLIPELGRSPGEGNGNPFQHSCLGNPGTREPVGLQSMG